MNPYISNELFHFFGRSCPDEHEANYDLLKRVLGRGCISHKPHDDNWGAVSYALDLSKRLAFEELIVPTVTCFCDIPFSSLPLHMEKYGLFGLSLSRHHLIKFGARPVIYVPTRPDDWSNSYGGGTALLTKLEATYRGLHSHLLPPKDPGVQAGIKPTQVPSTSAEAARHLDRTLALDVLAFVKPYDASLDENDPSYYYSEREWRKFGNMRFEPADVLQVVVHHQFVERAKVELPEYGERIIGVDLSKNDGNAAREIPVLP